MPATPHPSLVRRPTRLICGLLVLSVIAIATKLSAQSTDEFDSYKIRLEGDWVYSSPSGSLEGSSDVHSIDLEKDLHFNSYSTFFGKLDWKFTHKNHILVFGSRLNSTHETVLIRTITY